MLGVRAAQVDHAAVWIIAQKRVVKRRDETSIHFARQKLGCASAKLSETRRLGAFPGNHGLKLLGGHGFYVPSVKRADEVVYDGKIVFCRFFFLDHCDQRFAAIEIDHDVQCA